MQNEQGLFYLSSK